MAKLITCEKCKVDLDAILDIGAYDLERAKSIDPEAFSLPLNESQPSEHGRGHDQEAEEDEHGQEEQARAHEQPRHDTSIKSVFIEEAGSVDLTKFNYWMGDLLWERGEVDIYRMKAIMAIKGED